MASFDLNSITKALSDPNRTSSGVDFSGKSLKLDTEKDGMFFIPIIDLLFNLNHIKLLSNLLKQCGVNETGILLKCLVFTAQ